MLVPLSPSWCDPRWSSQLWLLWWMDYQNQISLQALWYSPKGHHWSTLLSEEKMNNWELQLSQSHEYYHQIQCQVAVCEKEYNDFICWIPHGMHMECILTEASYLSEAMPYLDAFLLKFFFHCCSLALLRSAERVAMEGDHHIHQWYHHSHTHVTTHAAHHINLLPVLLEILVKWLPLTILIIQWNGSTLSVLASPVNLRASGFALTIAKNRLSNFNN